MNTIPIKPLSVNTAWQGQRFKTRAYKAFEIRCLLAIKKHAVPEGKLSISLEFGLSNKAMDIDNPIKMCLDILQKKLLFNDSRIYSLNVRKVIVPKGSEYWSYKVERWHEAT